MLSTVHWEDCSDFCLYAYLYFNYFVIHVYLLCCLLTKCKWSSDPNSLVIFSFKCYARRQQACMHVRLYKHMKKRQY